MEIKVYGKPVMTKFVVLDGKEFELSKVYVSLEQIMDTKENDSCYGDYSLRDYQLISQEVMDQLVNMGLVKNYPGPRMANLYCMKDEKGIEKLQNILYELDMLQSDNKKDLSVSVLSTDFKEGYCDGHGQAIENVRFNLIGYLTEGKELTIDLVNDICDFCSKVDHDYLNQ